MNDQEYAFLKRKIKEALSIDLEAYKSQQMRRRLDSFVDRRDVSGAFRFAKTLERDKDALKELKDMLTINVTEFFRDTGQFNYLESVVLPELLRSRPRLNIWAAGCSHGAEPYSLAILLDELSKARSHRILATDIDLEMLNRAKAGGPYSASDVKNVSKLRLQKYFDASDGQYTVVDRLRPRLQVREHNLLSDSFDSGFDLVLCRNVVIYFTDETKAKLYERFCQSLRPGGVLFLGATEALLAANNRSFERLSANFYRKHDAAMDARLPKAA